MNRSGEYLIKSEGLNTAFLIDVLIIWLVQIIKEKYTSKNVNDR